MIATQIPQRHEQHNVIIWLPSMNELAEPLEKTDPAMATHFRMIANRCHPAIRRVLIGPITCREAGIDAQRILILRTGQIVARELKTP